MPMPAPSIVDFRAGKIVLNSAPEARGITMIAALPSSERIGGEISLETPSIERSCLAESVNFTISLSLISRLVS